MITCDIYVLLDATLGEEKMRTIITYGAEDIN